MAVKHRGELTGFNKVHKCRSIFKFIRFLKGSAEDSFIERSRIPVGNRNRDWVVMKGGNYQIVMFAPAPRIKS